MLAAVAPTRLQRVMARMRSDIAIVDWSPAFLDQALPIMHEMHANSIYADMPLDEAKVIRQLSASGSDKVPDRYFRVAVLRDEVLGAFYGMVQRTFFNDMLIAIDMGWWVKREARGTFAAPLLLLDFERWAREKGARKVCVAQSTAVNIDATTKLFEGCGFRVTGANTVKDL